MGQCCSNEHQQNLQNQFTEQYPKPQNPGQIQYQQGPPIQEGEYIDKLPKGYPSKEVKAQRKLLGDFTENMQNLQNISIEQSQQILQDIQQCDIFQMQDESIYQGQWKNGQKHGIGVLYHKNGSLYEGQFLNNKKQGYGRLITPNGEYYIGEFQNDKYHGHGVFIYVDGKKYEGQFLNGKKQGQGSMIWEDGKQYDGTWKDNKYSGNNIQHSKQKIKWKEGVPVESSSYKSQGQEENDNQFFQKKNIKVKSYNDNEDYLGQGKHDKQQNLNIQLKQNINTAENEEQQDYEQINLNINTVKQRLLTQDSLEDLQFEDLSQSVQQEMFQLKDSELKTLFAYLENKNYKEIVNIGINMLKTYKIIQVQILADYSMILYLVSLACINLGNNETAIFFLEQIEQIEFNFPRHISRDILAATYGMLSNANFQIEIDNPPRLQSFHDQTTNGTTQETLRDYNNMYQGSLKMANLYGNKAKEVVDKEEINFSVRSEVIINISVSFLESDPLYGYNMLKEELKDIEQRFQNIKQQQQINSQQNTKRKLKLNNIELYENFMISGLTNLSIICLQLKKTTEGFEVSKKALEFLNQPQQDQQKLKQKATIYSNLCYFGLYNQNYDNSIEYGEKALQTDQYYHFAYRHLILAYCQKPQISNQDKIRLGELVKHIIKFKDFFPNIFRKINSILKQQSPYENKSRGVSNNLFSTGSQTNIIVNQNQYNNTEQQQEEIMQEQEDLDISDFKIPYFGGPGNKLQQNQNIQISQDQIDNLIKYFQKQRI